MAQKGGRPRPSPCNDWKAWHKVMPGTTPPKLHVTATCQFPTAGYSVELVPAPGREQKPPVYVLQRVVHKPEGMVAQVITDVPLDYSVEVSGDYKTALIMPERKRIPVATGAVVTPRPVLGLPGVAQQKEVPEKPNYSEISAYDLARLNQQRDVVGSVAKRYGMGTLTRTKSDLAILQKLIDQHVFKKRQTYELQSLGVAFGDVLSSELPLRWVMVTDEYGTDPTLRFKDTTIQINALTMISKRIERGERPDVAELLRITRDQLNRHEAAGWK